MFDSDTISRDQTENPQNNDTVQDGPSKWEKL